MRSSASAAARAHQTGPTAGQSDGEADRQPETSASHPPTPATGARAAHRHRSTYVAAGDERRFVRRQEQRQVRDILRRPESAKRMPFHVARARRLRIGQSIEGRLQHRGIDRRGTDAVHANAVLGELERERAGQRDDARPSTSSRPPFQARRRCPVIDDMLTMAPPPASRISGMTARAQIHALRTFTRSTRSSSCAGDSASVPNDVRRGAVHQHGRRAERLRACAPPSSRHRPLVIRRRLRRWRSHLRARSHRGRASCGVVEVGDDDTRAFASKAHSPRRGRCQIRRR